MATKKGTRKKSVSRKAPRRPKTLNLDALPRETISPVELKLDPGNPRLSSDEQGSSPDKLLEIMLRRFRIGEVAESIVSRGYVPFDPIVCWREGSDVTVREGNRRVTALKLLLNPDLAPDRFRDQWRKLAQDAAGVSDSFQEIEVIIVPRRDLDEVLAYIGFRHVSGAMQWPAYEKAAFIAHLVDSKRWPYREVARRIGSRRDAVERHYVAYRLIQQAFSAGCDGADNMRNAFGVLMRALNAPGARRFLKLEYPGKPSLSKNPAKAAANLDNFVTWTFGTEDVAPVLGDSRQLTAWGRVLDSTAAVKYLTTTARPRLERALFKAGGEEESVEESLIAAAGRLEEALPHVKAYRKSEEVQKAIDSCAYFMAQILVFFPDAGEPHGLRIDDV